MSSIHPTEGSISGKPYGAQTSGRLHGDHKAPGSGSLHGAHKSPKSGPLHGPMHGPLHGALHGARAELIGLISNIGSLSAQAQSLPLSAPALPALPQTPGYQPQPTDYTQFGNDAN